jgi:hypothetical protein
MPAVSVERLPSARLPTMVRLAVAEKPRTAP